MRRIRVVSFNILHGQRADGSGVIDVPALQRSAVALRPDLLALQEVDVGVPRSGWVDQAAAVAEATGMLMVFGRAARVGGIGKYGNALLVRGSLADVERVALPREQPRNEPRAAILAAVDLDGVRLTVGATHLSIHRPEVHDQLRHVVDALMARPGPTVLMGDLNLLPEEVAPVVEARGLSLADPAAPTFPLVDPRIRIDHVAVGPGFDVVGVEVVATASSDHCALVVEVQVEGS